MLKLKMFRVIVKSLLASAVILGVTAPAFGETVKICHGTMSESNPYTVINIDKTAWDEGHDRHTAHLGDIEYDEVDGCGSGPVEPPPKPIACPCTGKVATGVNGDVTKWRNSFIPERDGCAVTGDGDVWLTRGNEQGGDDEHLAVLDQPDAYGGLQCGVAPAYSAWDPTRGAIKLDINEPQRSVCNAELLAIAKIHDVPCTPL